MSDMRKATAAQRKAYLKAINEKRPVPTGFVWDGIHLYIAPDAEKQADADEKQEEKDATD
jgi:hypothetical protein